MVVTVEVLWRAVKELHGDPGAVVRFLRLKTLAHFTLGHVERRH